MKLIGPVFEAIASHARHEFPNESCGLIVDGEYFPCFNYASDPQEDFIIDGRVLAFLEVQGKTVQCVVHSHPNGPYFPSELDMRSQIDSGLPWALVVTDGHRVSPPEIWGADTPIPAIVGRTFMHGIRDCYSLVRDVFRLGKDELAKQGINWPLPPIQIPDYPRNDGWWGTLMEPGDDLYIDNFKSAGFRIIKQHEAKPGDGFLHRIHSKNLNHAAVLTCDHLLIHHLPKRLSCREPAGIWARAADLWLRHESNDAT